MLQRRVLRFGCEQVEAFFDADRLAGRFEGPISDATPAAEMVRSGLENPLDAPPFVRAFAPGDRVTIAVDGALTDPAAILGPVLESLESAGVVPGDVTVLISGGEADAVGRFAAALDSPRRPGAILAHDPADKKSESYLASTKDGRRIYLNRELVDADAAVIVGMAGRDAVLGRRGSSTGVYPAMSNDDARRQSRAVALETQGQRESLRNLKLAEEVNWLLGAFYGIDVMLDRDNAVDRVWVGKLDAVGEASERYVEEHWSVPASEAELDLVIACVSPGPTPASWSATAAALDLAARFSRPKVDLLVVSDVADPPGPTGKWLVDAENPFEVLARLRESHEEDVVTTARFANALARHKVYFYSRLPAELVESLGMTPIADAKQLQRLISSRKRTYLLEQADRLTVRWPKKSAPARD